MAPTGSGKETYHGTEGKQDRAQSAGGLCRRDSGPQQVRLFLPPWPKKEGYEQIAAIFQATANNEKEHAKIWFKALGGIGTTAENLASAAAGENYEWTDMYDRMAQEAGRRASRSWRRSSGRWGRIEKAHEERLSGRC